MPVLESDCESLGVANAGLGTNGCCDRIITGLVLSFGFLLPLSFVVEGVTGCTEGDGMFMLGEVIITGLVFNFRLLSDPLFARVDTGGVEGDAEGKVMLVVVANAGLVFTFSVLSTPFTVSFFVSGEPNEGLTARPVFIADLTADGGQYGSCNGVQRCAWMLARIRFGLMCTSKYVNN